MGVEAHQRPPLPAPTEPTDVDDTDVATNISRRTDHTSYSIPEDGTPITISTHKLTSKEGPRLRHGRNKSQTSLLIEYFEATKGDKAKNRPSVRVKVTPSAHRKSKNSDSVQITGIGRDKKPSYTRCISLGGKSSDKAASTEPTEVSHSSESNVSAIPPVEVEILNNSDLSSLKQGRESRDLHYLPTTSDVSSMPPDSLLDPSHMSAMSQDVSEDASRSHSLLDLPVQDRARSASHERIKQKVIEKLMQRQREGPVEYEPDTKPTKERRRRSSRSTREDDLASAAESSILSSNLSPSNLSYVSGTTSKVSLNNPKLLQMVEDTVRRLILPEITQLKNEQHRSSHGSYTDDELDQRHYKSTSSPSLSSKPKVVLNRYDHDPGEVLSRGDSERREKTRRSSRTESERPHRERRSSRTSTREREESVHSRSSKDKESRSIKDGAAAGIAGGILTAAALRHHDSQDTVSRERRKKRKARGTRSDSTSLAETEKTYRKEVIPPMPWTGASAMNDSEITRQSILTASTERPQSANVTEHQTPVREVRRGSLRGSLSPASTTPKAKGARSPRSLESSQSRHSLTEEHFTNVQSISTKAKMAALVASGLGDVGPVHDIGKHAPSPTQSVSTLKDSPSDPLVPHGLRPRSRVSELSAGFEERQRHAMSPVSAPSSPNAQKKSFDLARASHSPAQVYDEAEERSELEEWFQQEHEKNEEYRKSLADTSTIPGSFDERRSTQYTDGSYLSSDQSPERDVRGIAATPKYTHLPYGVESAVASLVDPSTVSTSLQSSQASPNNFEDVRYRERMDDSEPRQSVEHQSTEAKTQYQTQNRWSALRENALALSSPGSSAQPTSSPHQSETFHEERTHVDSPPVRLSAHGIPDVNDPLPEIGHGIDSESDLSTNPPEIQGPGRGDGHFGFLPSFSHSPDREAVRHDSISEHSFSMNDKVKVGASIAAGAFAADKVLDRHSSDKHLSANQAVIEDYASRETTPDVRQAQAVHVGRAGTTSPPAHFGDEGYASAAYARSNGASTPGAHKTHGQTRMEEYDVETTKEDAFIGKHSRHFSGNSHGMSSPLYDSATGRGIDTIQSKDVVALMDHLTVRDAHRNARDTEILVTLVRSAAEMRHEFEEMKRFIAEQDRKIMENTDRDAEYTVKKVLGGPRPQPTAQPRTVHGTYNEEDLPTKRKNVFKRALKGLSKRGSNDLSKIEDMLNQILGDVEDLKLTQGDRPPMSLRGSSFDSYEDRAHYGRDSGYEPEGQAGTSSTPNHSGRLSNPSGNASFSSPKESATSPQERYFHSGYNGRRDSINRVSTVQEEESNDGSSFLEQHETHVLDNQFENNERLLTPTQESFNRRSGSFDSTSTSTPVQQRQSLFDTQAGAGTPDKQRKQSVFGIPKISRWSKTTTSSYPENSDVNGKRRSQHTNASSSGESLGSNGAGYYGNGYALQSEDRLRSTQSLVKDQAIREHAPDNRSVRSGLSDMTRTPSPLIPSETGSQLDNIPIILPDDDEVDNFDDPKYSAHRDSLLLQHPQPRPGPTHRHQTNLEKEARTYSGPDHFETATSSDLSQRTVDSDFDPLQWGSNPSLSLARTNKLSGIPAGKDNGPLVPESKQKPAPRVEVEPPKEQRQQAPQKPRQMYYSTPLGSGHLLEPIEEVRYSLETDRGLRSPEPTASPRVVTQLSPTRKITGPRPMGSSRAPSGAQEEAQREQLSGTVRRKPVPSSKSFGS
ncbi:hypothetical protein E4T52_11391 [Aureobasidium sp. EXF-3400]|nr:hypothetical protein E4T51_10399 [Aureobasidium sp. EXF-12344]KAI4773643.1 hypothetical protein E4T52_11391 [Aureobasidium sp. EXF-3400]